MDLRRSAAFVRDRRLFVLAVALAAIALGLSSMAASFHAIERTTRTAEREAFAEVAEYAYHVPVTRNSTHWPQGTLLPMGMPAYYRTVSDRVPVDFAWRASGAKGLVDAEMTLRVRAEARDGRIYWEIERPLASVIAADAATGIRLDAEILLDDLVAEVGRVAGELPPGDGALNWSLETLVTYAVESDAGAEASQRSFLFPFRIDDPRVVLPKAAEVSWRVPHTTTNAWVVESTAGWTGAMSNVRGLALLAGGAATLTLLAWAVWLDPVARLGKREASYVIEHDKHREWVTTVAGELDVTTFPETVIDVGDLQTLVETASDARCRVLHDAHLRVYYAVLPHATYRYARHAGFPGRRDHDAATRTRGHAVP